MSRTEGIDMRKWPALGWNLSWGGAAPVPHPGMRAHEWTMGKSILDGGGKRV